MAVCKRDPDVLDRVKSLLGEDGYAQTFAELDEPSGLPNTAYWSKDWLDLEFKRIFRRNWIYVAANTELDEPGSIKPMDIAGTPVVVTRGTDNIVRAFHNVCRHRGTQLVSEACRSNTITCPYHAWNYGLDGSLRSRPHFHGPGEIERFEDGGGPQLDLYPIRCEEWNGCYFIDLSGSAPSLEDWLQPMCERTSAFDFSCIRWIGKRQYTIKSNWKLVLENYMEGYHVFAAHPRLIAHAPMDVRWSGEWLGHVFYNDYVAPQITEGRGDVLPHFPNLSPDDTHRGMWFACFPNFAVQVFADQFVVLATYPVAPDQTLEELHFFVAGEEAASSDTHEEGRRGLLEMWHELNLEDVELLERLQQGRRSIAFDGSIMSPAWEVPAHQLSQQVINSIVAA